eukprot:jgi/Phyca11/126377/e_gw1.62.142.1
MADCDWGKRKEKNRGIRENTISARSRITYQNSYCRFLAWVVQNKSELVSAPFAESLDDTSDCSLHQLRSRVKEKLCPQSSIIPLEFEALTAEVFVTWLVTLTRKDGSGLSYSALNTHRASLFNLYRDYGCTMSKTLELELTTYFKGLKHTLAKEASNGTGRIKTGKDPLMFDLYIFPCKKMLLLPGKDMVFSHAYMVIAWNLMCRLSNAFEIRHSHMEWKSDALQIYFAHMKNDQGGERPRDPQHIYANPWSLPFAPLLRWVYIGRLLCLMTAIFSSLEAISTRGSENHCCVY